MRSILPQLSPASQEAIAKLGLGRFSWWHARMTETVALVDLPLGELLEVLLCWACEAAPLIDQRLARLEFLLQRLEQSAVDRDSGLRLVGTWARKELVGTPVVLEKVLVLLDQLAIRTGPNSKP